MNAYFALTSINYLGVSAEDSIFCGEYGHRRMSLDSFLSLYNRSSRVEKNLSDKIDAVFQKYVHAIDRDIEEYEAVVRSLKTVDLDIFGEGNLTLSEKTSERIEDISARFRVDSLKLQKDKAMDIASHLKGAVHDIFDEIV